jgi:FkbM family methyltransferase
VRVLEKIGQGIAIGIITRRHYRAAQVPNPCLYHFGGTACEIGGPDHLSLVLESWWRDAYGIRGFSSLNVIVDVGANIGTFSLSAITRFPDSKVYAFEPSPSAFAHLKANTRGRRIHSRQVAIGGRDSMMSLIPSRNLASTSVNELQTGVGERQCRMVAFDTLAKELGSISFLKLDCEGSEYGIMKSDALDCVENIAAELHSTADETPDSGLAILKSRGFTVTKWNPFPGGRSGIVFAVNSKLRSSRSRLWQFYKK